MSEIYTELKITRKPTISQVQNAFYKHWPVVKNTSFMQYAAEVAQTTTTPDAADYAALSLCGWLLAQKEPPAETTDAWLSVAQFTDI